MFKEYFVYGLTKALSAGTGVAFETINTRIDSDADFEFKNTVYTATNDRVKIKYKDDSMGRFLNKGKTDIKGIAGRNNLPMGSSNSFLPFIWPRPYIISAGTNFVTEAADYSNAANTVNIAYHGAKLRPGEAPWKRRFRAAVPFVYSFTEGPVTIAASSTITSLIEIDIDAHFLVQKITGIRSGTGNITATESARGKEWSNISIPFDNFMGNGAFPNVLTANRFIPRGSVVTFNLQDTSGLSNIVDINLIGVKLYE